MKGLIEGGSCEGSQVELKKDLVFRLTPLSGFIVLHKKLNRGMLGTVIRNSDKLLAVRFDGDYEVVFHKVESVRGFLKPEM